MLPIDIYVCYHTLSRGLREAIDYPMLSVREERRKSAPSDETDTCGERKLYECIRNDGAWDGQV